MKHASTGLRCAVGAAVSALLLASGCTADRTGNDSESKGGATGNPAPTEGTGAEDDPAPAPEPTVEADPAKVPSSKDAARKLIREVIAGPELFGAGTRRASPYESDPETWSVLDDGCVWRREPLPEAVLATLTRHFELPAAQDKGPVRMTVTVTVHPETADAAWEQAGMLEEALSCSEQTLSEGRKLTGLFSNASVWGEAGNNYAEDSLFEMGSCTSPTDGGPYPYQYQQATFGPVVVSMSACAGEGWEAKELLQTVNGPVPRMLLRAEGEIGRPVDDTGSKADPAAHSAPGGAGNTPGTAGDAPGRVGDTPGTAAHPAPPKADGTPATKEGI
ncbi:hypothetical protein [Streptomyces sp. NPDC000983]|uniref:hypothetical protein n=1 Tax=Streptomyces sp. NPDC000983 TaxID=3154373 RepID=UPI0033339CAD